MMILTTTFILILWSCNSVAIVSSADEACEDCGEVGDTSVGTLRARKTMPKDPIDIPDPPSTTTPRYRLMDFEGIPDFTRVGNYYNGGGGATKNYGVSYSHGAFASVDTDVGVDGSGYFANEPSPSTAMWDNYAAAILSVSAGFVNEVSFYYANPDFIGNYTIYAGSDGTGTIIRQGSLPATGRTYAGDPTGTADKWNRVRANFTGTAHSLVLRGAFTFYDNIAMYVKPL